MSERNSHIAKEKSLTSLNKAKQEELDLLEADEKKLDMELGALSSRKFLRAYTVSFFSVGFLRAGFHDQASRRVRG